MLQERIRKARSRAYVRYERPDDTSELFIISLIVERIKRRDYRYSGADESGDLFSKISDINAAHFLEPVKEVDTRAFFFLFLDLYREIFLLIQKFINILH